MRRIPILFIYLSIYVACPTPLRAQALSLTDHLLLVRAAEQAGLDTLPAFKTAVAGFRYGLIRAELTDEAAMEQAVRQKYDELKESGRLKQVRIRQIFLPLKQNTTKSVINRAVARMDSVYQVVRRDTTKARFITVADKLSAEKRLLTYRPMQMPMEMEAVADTLRVGHCSPPFFTALGIHILRLEERTEALPFEAMRAELTAQLACNYRTDKGAQAKMEELKTNYRFKTNQAAINELQSKGTTTRTLFTIEDTPYNGADFARFAGSYPAGFRRQWEAFVVKSLFDYADNKLEQASPLFEQAIKGYRDSLLIAAIIRREIDEKHPVTDQVLQAYFEEHRDDYRWEAPRFRGIVLYATTKRMAKQARKLLKQLPEAEWQDALRLTLNADGQELVRSEQGLFKPGDNPHVDRKYFKKKQKPAVDMSYPFTQFLGKKVKGPERLEEVRELVVRDYRRSLMEAWLRQLRKGGKVEIDQEVLKTVNNQ